MLRAGQGRAGAQGAERCPGQHYETTHGDGGVAIKEVGKILKHEIEGKDRLDAVELRLKLELAR
jgi:hypothetical protein